MNNNINVNDDVSKIENLVKKLREISPTHFSQRDASLLLMSEHLDFLERSEDICRLYNNVRYITISPNGVNYIWQATLAQDRPLAGLKAGDIIAIKMKGSIPKPFKNSLGSLEEIQPLIRLSHFKNIKIDEPSITDYFPNFYGVYYGDKMPCSLVPEEYPKELKNYTFEKAYFRYEEMEWIDTTLSEKYANCKIPDPVLFELMYGEWAGQFFIGLSIGDCKGDNYGLKTVNYKRIYHLGENIYSFSSTDMPIRLDLEEFYSFPHPTKKRFKGENISKSSFKRVLNQCAETQNGQEFLNNLFNSESSIFDLFKKYFNAYQINSKEADEQTNAKHFYLCQKWIDQENSLPK